MPGKTDDFFRDRLKHVPEANPPPGQWEKIRNRELIVNPAMPLGSVYWAIGSLMLGVLIGGFGMWWYTSAYPLKDVVAQESVSISESAQAAEEPINVGPKEEAFAGVLKPKDEQGRAMPAIMAKEKPSGNVLAVRSVVTTILPSEEKEELSNGFAQQPGKVIAEEEKKLSQQVTDTAYYSSPRTRVRAATYRMEDTTQYRSMMVNLPVATTALLGTANIAQATLTGYADRAFIVLPKPIIRRPTPPGRWEAGFSFSPGLTNSRVTSRVFTEQNNGNTSQTFTFNNQQIELFADDIFDQEVKQQLQLSAMIVEGARQFANGTRIGLGMSYSPYTLSGLNNPNEVLAPLLQEGEFASYSWSYEKKFSAFVSGGYTFLRRRKVRPYIGMILGLDFYQEGERKSYLFRGVDGRSEEFLSNRYNSTEGLRQLIFNISTQVGVQYQVHKRISLGVDVLPELALGGRYRF